MLALASLACGSQSSPIDASVIPGADSGLPDAAAPTDAGPRGPGPCVAVRPDDAAWLAEPGPLRAPEPDGGLPEADPDAGGGCLPRACIGAEAPIWALTDFQPQSCGSGATYGLDVFRGKVTVVALLAAW